jgi:hypothetical protein
MCTAVSNFRLKGQGKVAVQKKSVQQKKSGAKSHKLLSCVTVPAVQGLAAL